MSELDELNTSTNGEQPPAPKAKRHRRTKAEMEAARAKEKVTDQDPFLQAIGYTKGYRRTRAEMEAARARAAENLGSQNKPKSVEPNPDLKETDRAAGEVSTENNSKTENLSVFEASKSGIGELYDLATERKILAQAQAIVDRINLGIDAAVQKGREMMYVIRNTGTLYLEWKAAVGHGNWTSWYEGAGFKLGLDTAQTWMRISFMTDTEIEQVTSVNEALKFLRDKKAQKKGKGGNPNPGLDDDDNDGNGDGTWVGKLMQAAKTPHLDESKPDPEVEKQAREKIKSALHCLSKPKDKKAVDFWMADLQGEEGTVCARPLNELVDYVRGHIGRDEYLHPNPEPGKPEPEFELTLLDELEMVVKRVCSEHTREETVRMLMSMLNDYYQPKEEATV